MAQTDFFFNSDGLSTLTSASGHAVLHASLSNPLTSEGLYCRYWETAQADTISSTKGVFARSLDTRFEQKIAGKAVKYSVRALVRVPSAANFLRTAAGIRMKSDNTRVVGRNTNAYTGGYKMFLHNGNIYTGMETDNGTDQLYVISGSLGVPVVQDSWYRLRMDVTPVKLGGSVITDKVEYFTGTGETGREQWTLVGSYDFTSSRLIPWGSTTYKNNGFFLADTHSGVVGSSIAAAYFDSFQVLVSGR